MMRQQIENIQLGGIFRKRFKKQENTYRSHDMTHREDMYSNIIACCTGLCL